MGAMAPTRFTRGNGKNRWQQWKEFFGFTRPGLFLRDGRVVAGLCAEGATREFAMTGGNLDPQSGWRSKSWIRRRLRRRYPQICLDGIATGLLEPESGVLMARRAVAAVVEDAIFRGVQYRVAEVVTPDASGGAGSQEC